MVKNNESCIEMANKVFSTLNNKFFNNDLPTPMFRFWNNKKSTTIDRNYILVKEKQIIYQMTIPIERLSESIEHFVIAVLDGMISMYDTIYERKWFSRGYSYKNAGYREFIEHRCHLNCDRDEIYGYKIKNDELITALCEECGFKKTWGNLYKYENNNNNLNRNTRSALKPSSTKKYVDSEGHSVRATKDHFLICFDSCPEIGEQVEQMFGLKRMRVED